MSIASKITLGVACAVSASIIGYVHYKQSSDREKLHEGVVRDVERQQRRKLENTYELQKQIDLTKQFREIQTSQEIAQNSTAADMSTKYKNSTKSRDVKVESVRNATNEINKDADNVS